MISSHGVTPHTRTLTLSNQDMVGSELDIEKALVNHGQSPAQHHLQAEQQLQEQAAFTAMLH